MTLVDLGLLDPVPQRLRIDPELLAHAADRSPNLVDGCHRASTAILVALSRSSSGYFPATAMLLILPWNQSLDQKRGDSLPNQPAKPIELTSGLALAVAGDDLPLAHTAAQSLVAKHEPIRVCLARRSQVRTPSKRSSFNLSAR